VRVIIQRCPNGETHPAMSGIRRKAREPGELKHLSTRRKRDDSASSGERKWNSPNRQLRLSGLKDRRNVSRAEPNGSGKANDTG
jgi:hypothetical protein